MSVKDEDRKRGSRVPEACGVPGLGSPLGALSPRKRMVVFPCQLKSGPQDTVPPTCDCVTCLGRRDFADVTKFWILRWGHYLGLSIGPSVITRVLRGRCDYRRGAGRAWGVQPQTKECWRPPEAGRGEEGPSSSASRSQPCPHLVSAR